MILGDAEDHFRARLSHRLDRNALRLGVGHGGGDPLVNTLTGGAQLVFVGDAQLDPADIGLVRDLVGDHLERDRVAELGGVGGGLVDGGGQPGSRSR